MIHLGDITKVNGANIEPVDCITFGSPCFPKGTLILTKNGYIPIEDINVGDEVLTHLGNWKKVEKTGSKIADTIMLDGSGLQIECTGNHPFYSRTNEDDTPDFKQASSLKDAYVAKLMNVPALDIPSIEDYRMSNKENHAPSINKDLFYFIGRWLGDGWVRDSQRSDRKSGQKHSTILICDSFDKANELAETFARCFTNFSCSREKTVVKYRTTNAPFCRWLTTNFGKGAINKTLPGWVYSMNVEYKEQLLKGYLDSDGTCNSDTLFRASTISHKLAQGICLLAESLMYETGCKVYVVKPKGMIEGRIVNQHDFWTISLNKNTRKSFRDTFRWQKVKTISDCRKNVTVYNLQVADDHTYIANGFVVHNCQDLSIAGKRAGLDGERSGLFMEAVRIIKEMREHELERIRSTGSNEHIRPRFAVWENVPGAFSSNNGEDFRVVLEELIHIRDKTFNVPRCKDGKWQHSGLIIGDDWSIAWRTMDAQYWGVPQRRKRIALVMDFTGRCAGEVLFESESLHGDSEPSISPWKGVARCPEECTSECDSDSYTLKIRGGADTYLKNDGSTGTAGKGALIQHDMSATLGATQDQTLFS